MLFDIDIMPRILCMDSLLFHNFSRYVRNRIQCNCFYTGILNRQQFLLIRKMIGNQIVKGLNHSTDKAVIGTDFRMVCQNEGFSDTARNHHLIDRNLLRGI